MKLALTYIGPFQFSATRNFFGSLVLLSILRLLKKPLKPTQIPMTIILGLLQTTGFTGLIIWALVEGGAGKVAVLTFTMPFWVMLMAWPLLGEKIRGMQWLAVVMAVAGLCSIIEPWNFHGKLLSNILAILAGISWGLGVILSKKLHKRAPGLDVLSFTAWQMLFGSLPLVLLAFLVPAQPIVWSHTMIGAVLFNIILVNSLGWWLWLYALHCLPAGVASMNLLLIPIIAVVAAWIQLHEVPSPSESIGMVLIACALVTISIRAIHKHETPDPAMGQD